MYDVVALEVSVILLPPFSKTLVTVGDAFPTMTWLVTSFAFAVNAEKRAVSKTAGNMN